MSAQAFFRDCLPDAEEDMVRDVLSRAAGKWPAYVLHVLGEADVPLRYSAVRKSVEGITQRVLTHTLRHLERDGFISRRIYPTVPPRVEYALTPLGHAFIAQVDPVIAWARAQASAFAEARSRFEAEAAGA